MAIEQVPWMFPWHLQSHKWPFATIPCAHKLRNRAEWAIEICCRSKVQHSMYDHHNAKYTIQELNAMDKLRMIENEIREHNCVRKLNLLLLIVRSLSHSDELSCVFFSARFRFDFCVSNHQTRSVDLQNAQQIPIAWDWNNYCDYVVAWRRTAESSFELLNKYSNSTNISFLILTSSTPQISCKWKE